MAYLLEDYLWDGYFGYPKRPFNQQPEMPKRKYVKSGKYSTKNKIAEAKNQLIEAINNMPDQL